MGQLAVAEPPPKAEPTGGNKQQLPPGGVDPNQTHEADGQRAAQHS